MPREHQADDPYELLGVAPDASPDEIRLAFRARARAVHPDVSRAPDAAAAFDRLRRAYGALTDPEARSRVDAERARSRRSGGTFTWSNIAGTGPGSAPGAGAWDDELGSAFDAVFGGG